MNAVKQKFRKRKRGQPKGRSTNLATLDEIRHLLGEQPKQRDLLIEYLHLIQDHYGFISADHITALAQEMKLAPAEIYEVASFYHHFDVLTEGQTPPPPLTIRVCDSVTCEMFGAEDLIASLQAKYPDHTVRVQRVPCVGRCETAPIAVVGQAPVLQADLEKIADCIADKTTTAPAPNAIDYDSYRKEGGYQLLEDHYWRAIQP